MPDQPMGGGLRWEDGKLVPIESGSGGGPVGGDDRTGPPWENPGEFVRRFVDTAKGVLTNPAELFRTMRRTGGLGPPITYVLVGGLISVAASCAYLLLQQMMTIGVGGGSDRIAGAFGMMAFAAVFFVVSPILLLVGMFIYSGITHLMLMLLGAANHGFETTFRVLAYTVGSSNLLSVIPVCGGILGGIANIVIGTIGLKEAQETSTEKAAAAILLPVVLCCAVGVIAVFSIIAMFAGGRWN